MSTTNPNTVSQPTELREFRRTYYNQREWDYANDIDTAAPPSSANTPAFEKATIKEEKRYRNVKYICVGVVLGSLIVVGVTIGVTIGRLR